MVNLMGWIGVILGLEDKSLLNCFLVCGYLVALNLPCLCAQSLNDFCCL